MADIIYLVHRLPFPPDKGDKIRSFNLLYHLSRQFDVHLGCFVDDNRDQRYISEVEKFCKTTFVRKLDPGFARIKSLIGVLTGRPLSVPYYADSDLLNWVQSTAEKNDIQAIVGFSSPMSQYLGVINGKKTRKIMDFVDVDSNKWHQYAESRPWPFRLLYSREARYLARFERESVERADATTFVSEQEVKQFLEASPDLGHRVFVSPNGVDTQYFDPDGEFGAPFPYESKAIVFTGMMNYWPNQDAMIWFAREIYPQVRRAVPEAELWIVGASPSRSVTELSSISGIHVTGRVDDVRPYLKHASIVVAPFRVARGIQNKVLEALAMGKTVVCSSAVVNSLQKSDHAPVYSADSGVEFSETVARLLLETSPDSVVGEARQYVRANYDWVENLSIISQLVMGQESAVAY